MLSKLVPACIGLVAMTKHSLCTPVKAKCQFNLGKQPGRGFTDRVDWRCLSDARKESSIYRKPILVIVHTMDLDHEDCKQLKVGFNEHGWMWRLNPDLIMVNVLESEIDKFLCCYPQWEPQFRPDGRYLPRCLFFPPAETGWFLKCHIKTDNKCAAFKYTDIEELFCNARKVVNGA